MSDHMLFSDTDLLIAFIFITLFGGIGAIILCPFPWQIATLATILFLMFWAIMMAIFRIANRMPPRSVVVPKGGAGE
jgi:hypothetical protein